LILLKSKGGQLLKDGSIKLFFRRYKDKRVPCI